MEIAGNSNAETSTAFLQQLRANHPGPLVVIWDNGPAHRGAAIRSYLTTPDLHLRLVALPAYSPDFNADEAVWDWAREEVTANECLGTKAKVQEKMNQFFDGLTHRKDEVRHRCRTLLQARADALMFTPAVPLPSLPKCSSHLGFGLGRGHQPPEVHRTGTAPRAGRCCTWLIFAEMERSLARGADAGGARESAGSGPRRYRTCTSATASLGAASPR